MPTLFNEAYEVVPADQSELICDLLGGLEDEAMARRIAAKQHETIREKVDDIIIYVHRGDFLRKRKQGKVSAVEPLQNEILKRAVEHWTKPY